MTDTVTGYRLMLPFDRPPLTANEARSRAHWTRQREAKQTVEQAVMVLCRHHKIPPMGRVRVTLVWHAPDRRRRDADALGPMVKACLDGIRDAGVVADDHGGLVRAVTLVVEPASRPARLELLIEEAP